MDQPAALLDRIRDGDRRALARALTLVENGLPAADALMRALPPAAGAHRIGVTGPPGAGKSTLVAALARRFRAQDQRVGVLAVDPSSPFTGGALLGDRVRMLEHAGDDGVFIRSLASRGALGGLAIGVYDAADLLEAAGFDPILIETVGVGQGEVDVCRVADTTVVVLAPGSGDDVQGLKAGLLEAADVLVVNQGDRRGADTLAASLQATLEMRTSEQSPPPVLITVATTGEGLDALAQLLAERGRAADAERDSRRLGRARARVHAEVVRRILDAVAEAGDEFEAVARRVAAGESSVADAATELLEVDDLDDAEGDE